MPNIMLELLLFPVEKQATTPLIEVVRQSQVEVAEKSEDKQVSKKKPTKKTLTVKEKIAKNYYKCDLDQQYVRADNAQCLDKPVPVPAQPVVVQSTQQRQPRAASTQTTQAVKPKTVATVKTVAAKPAVKRAATGGRNTYTPGQCTWHVKNLKPSIPNGWGSASSWLYNARRSGWTVSSKPVVGAVGARGNHVVYVTAVKGSTVSVTEMNYNFIPYNIHRGDYPISYFTYIY